MAWWWCPDSTRKSRRPDCWSGVRKWGPQILGVGTMTLRMIWEAASKKWNLNYKSGQSSNRGISLKCWVDSQNPKNRKKKALGWLDWWWSLKWRCFLDLGSFWDAEMQSSSSSRAPYGSGLDSFCLLINPFVFNKCLLISLSILGRISGAKDRTVSKT